MQASYFFYRISEFLSNVIPLRWAYMIGQCISKFVYHTSKPERLSVRRNLIRVLGPEVGGVDQKVKKVYANFSRNCVEFLYYARRKKGDLARRIYYECPEYLDQALALRKGLVVLSTHLGNWEMGAMAISALKRPFHVMANTHPDPRINRLFLSRRRTHHINVIPREGFGIRQCLRALKRNELVGIMGDRRYAAPGIRLKFFGRETRLPAGPGYLSVKTGAPIVGAYTLSEGGAYRVRFMKPLYPDRFEEQVYYQKIVNLMEQMIRQQPTSWCAFEDIWD